MSTSGRSSPSGFGEHTLRLSVRALAEYAFTLGVQRVTAYVSVGNAQSERVLERAGFTREGVLRSMPKPDGRRVDMTIFSMLPGE